MSGIDELRAEVARLLDLACTCESDPCCGCEAHRTSAPQKCLHCGHTAASHTFLELRPQVGAECYSRAPGHSDCPCPGYEPAVTT